MTIVSDLGMFSLKDIKKIPTIHLEIQLILLDKDV